MPASTHATPPLPALSPVGGKPVIARVEAEPRGTDSRFVVTNLATGTARTIHIA